MAKVELRPGVRPEDGRLGALPLPRGAAFEAWPACIGRVRSPSAPRRTSASRTPSEARGERRLARVDLAARVTTPAYGSFPCSCSADPLPAPPRAAQAARPRG